MRIFSRWLALGAAVALGAIGCADKTSVDDELGDTEADLESTRFAWNSVVERSQERLFREGRAIFRDDTFGSEHFFGGQLKLHQAIAGAPRGGIGDGLSPAMALKLGLKVASARLPEEVRVAIREGTIDLNDPAVTLTLLKLNAVVGLVGFFEGENLVSVGTTCAFCHSDVDDRVAPGIGVRRDGWPNRDLDVGQIVALSPDLTVFQDLLGVDRAMVEQVLKSWGPGKYDAFLNMDGKAFRPDGKPGATLIPPAYGLAGQSMATYNGMGSISYWNAYVANTQMHGLGTFVDRRLADDAMYPLVRTTGFDDKRDAVDLISEKLDALHVYQIAIPAPKVGQIDREAAIRGEALFRAKAQCAGCHVPPLYAEPGYPMHTPAEIGIDAFQANRSPTHMYRTTPLRGLVAHQKGGFYHDGRFATLMDVIKHYDRTFALALSEAEMLDLEQFLRTL